MRTRRNGGCLDWTGTVARKRGGYGHFYDDDQRLKRAPRVAWELTHGVPVPTGQVVRHTCDRPVCVEPAHLLLGTQSQNLEDMRVRGRAAEPKHEHGEERYNAKLTDDSVRWAKERHAAGASYSSLARQLGVSRPCVTMAIKGESWTHLG